MSRSVALGGDRIGSGNKMNVELHGFERSNHNLDYIWKNTQAAGTIVPFLSKVILPGDIFTIDLDCNVLTHPTIGPLFGSFKVQLDLFQIPVRLYVGILHQNAFNIGRQMGNVNMPLLEMGARWNPTADDIDNSQINPSCIFKYLGISGLGRTATGEAGDVARAFNAIPYVGYFDIVSQYYCNKQEEKGYYIHWEPIAVTTTITSVTIPTPAATIPQNGGNTAIPITRSTSVRLNYSGATPKPEQIVFRTNRGDLFATQIWEHFPNQGTYVACQSPIINTSDLSVYYWRYVNGTDPQDREPKLVAFDLQNIVNMRRNLQIVDGLGGGAVINAASPAPYGPPMIGANGQYSKMSSQEGLAVKTYQSDIKNNWLNEEWIDGEDGVNEISAVAVTDDSFTIDAFNLANKVYNLYNRIAVSDGTYGAYIGAAYDHDLYGLCQNPVYEGGLSKELEFQAVVSTAANIEGEQPIGTLAGRGMMGQRHKGGRATIQANEIGWVQGLVSITPRIDYSQGNEWDINLRTIADFHVPNLDGIGFQDLNAERLHWTATRLEAGVPTYESVGKQPAWIEYMTSVSTTFGNFAIKGQEMFMTLNRQYSVGASGITDITTYIDPVLYNQIFAYTKRDAMNFWVQIRVGLTARRKMSAKVMPNI